METSHNATFRNLLTEYSLPEDLNFSIELPAEVERIISGKIIVNEFGIGLGTINMPTADNSFDEDFQNHFHVDSFVQNGMEKEAFALGVKTIMELAKRFQKENIKNVQLQYYFQTPEMAKYQFRDTDSEDSEQYASDRLSFHMKREGEIVTVEDLFDTEHGAFLLIDL